MRRDVLPFLLVLVGCGGSPGPNAPTPANLGTLTLADAGSFSGSLAPLANRVGYGDYENAGGEEDYTLAGHLHAILYTTDEFGNYVPDSRPIAITIPRRDLVRGHEATIRSLDGASLEYGEIPSGATPTPYWRAVSGRIKILSHKFNRSGEEPYDGGATIQLEDVRIEPFSGSGAAGAAVLNGTVFVNTGIAPV